MTTEAIGRRVDWGELFETLLDARPDPGCIWPEAERQRWLHAVEVIGALAYLEGVPPTEPKADLPPPRLFGNGATAPVSIADVIFAPPRVASAPAPPAAPLPICPDCGKPWSVSPSYQARVEARKYQQFADRCQYCYSDRVRTLMARESRQRAREPVSVGETTCPDCGVKWAMNGKRRKFLEFALQCPGCYRRRLSRQWDADHGKISAETMARPPRRETHAKAGPVKHPEIAMNIPVNKVTPGGNPEVKATSQQMRESGDPDLEFLADFRELGERYEQQEQAQQREAADRLEARLARPAPVGPIGAPATPLPDVAASADLEWHECPMCHNRWALDPSATELLARRLGRDPETAEYCFGCYKAWSTGPEARPKSPWRLDQSKRGRQPDAQPVV